MADEDIPNINAVKQRPTTVKRNKMNINVDAKKAAK